MAWSAPVAAVVHYLTTHVPHGFVLAHVGPTYEATQVTLQPAHVYPATSLISLQVSAHGSGAVVRIDGEALWTTPRMPGELIPAATSAARVTIYPQHGTKTRVVLTGKAVRTLSHALDALRPVRPYVTCPRTAATTLLKLEVVYHVGRRVLTFYWANNDCTLNAVVDRGRATGLADPPTALVERLLHWR